MKYLCWYHQMDTDKYINSLLITFILSCMGDRKRSIPKVKGLGFKTVYKNLLKLYDAGYLFDENPETFGIQNLISILNQNEFVRKEKEVLGNEIMANYRCYDLESQFKAMNKAQKGKITDQIIDRTDVSALMEINDRYFEECPIMLMELVQYRDTAKILK